MGNRQDGRLREARGRVWRKRHAAWLAATAAAALGAGSAAWGQDVTIGSDVTTGVNLDTQTGSTAEVSAGVSVTNASLSKAISATTSAWTLTNRGSVSSSYANAVQLDFANSSVINYGSIAATGVANAISLTGGGAVDNKAGATIAASQSAIILGKSSGGAGTVTNAGTITQTGTIADLVALLYGGTVTNLAGGKITANNTGNAVSIGQGASRTLVNSGTIENLAQGNYSTGVLLQGGASTLTNNAGGIIRGGYNGVYTSGSAPLTFANAGLIETTGSNAGSRAVEATGGGTFVNSGTIRSASGEGFYTARDAVLTNSGTIQGAVRAINFAGNYTRTLNLDTGSVLIGQVQGGTGTDNLVLLGTGTEDISKFLAFETLSLQGSAWTLTGAGTFSTGATVQSGALTVNGTLTSPTLAVAGGGTLKGTGTIAGATSVADGGTIAGRAGQVLTFNALALNDTSNVDVSLGAPSTSALFKVNGALTFDGRLNIFNAGGLDLGTYRLFDYGGALTNNGLVVNAVPAGFNPGDWDIDAGTPGQVDLVVLPGAGAQYWDGANQTPGGVANGRGGSGVWNAANTNWTNASGTINAAWASQNAVFTAAGPATVTVEGAQTFTGLRFLDGADYTFNAGTGGGLVTTGGPALIATEQGGAQATTARIAAPIGGTGGIAKSGAGTLVLTGTNTYSGSTSVTEGTLSLNGGSIAGDVTVSSGATFAIDRSDSSTFAGTIAGDGAFAKRGTGALVLSGMSGGFAGTGTVEAGTLDLAGALGGSLTVASGARLQGVGTAGAVSIASGGTIAPGGGIATLSAASVTFAPGSIYEVEANNAGQADRLAVSGTATVNGGTVQVLAQNGTYALSTQYTILTAAGGVGGAGFDGVTSNLAFLTSSLQRTANSILLTLTRNSIDLDAVGGTPNERAAGRMLQSVNAGAVYDAVLSLDAAGARAAFDAISGEIHPSLRTVLFEDSRYAREAVLHRLERAGEPGLALWADGFGDWGQSRGDGNAARLGRAASGFFMGLDTALGGNWRVGVAGGYSHHALDLPARLSNGEADLTQGLIYAGANYGALRLSLGAGYAHVSARTDRSAAFAGFTDRLRARYGGTILQGFGEIGYRVALGGGTVEPFARVAVVDLRTDAFAESGGAAALRGDATNETRTTTTLGLHLATPVAGKLSVDARIGWQHAFGAPVPVDTLRLAGGSGFGIAGVPYSREAGVMEGGFTFQASPGLAFWARYSGMIGDQGHDHAVKGSVSLRF